MDDRAAMDDRDVNDPERPLAGMKFRSAASPPVGYAATLVRG